MYSFEGKFTDCFPKICTVIYVDKMLADLKRHHIAHMCEHFENLCMENTINQVKSGIWQHLYNEKLLKVFGNIVFA